MRRDRDTRLARRRADERRRKPLLLRAQDEAIDRAIVPNEELHEKPERIEAPLGVVPAEAIASEMFGGDLAQELGVRSRDSLDAPDLRLLGFDERSEESAREDVDDDAPPIELEDDRVAFARDGPHSRGERDLPAGDPEACPRAGRGRRPGP